MKQIDWPSMLEVPKHKNVQNQTDQSDNLMDIQPHIDQKKEGEDSDNTKTSWTIHTGIGIRIQVHLA